MPVRPDSRRCAERRVPGSRTTSSHLVGEARTSSRHSSSGEPRSPLRTHLGRLVRSASNFGVEPCATARSPSRRRSRRPAPSKSEQRRGGTRTLRTHAKSCGVPCAAAAIGQRAERRTCSTTSDPHASCVSDRFRRSLPAMRRRRGPRFSRFSARFRPTWRRASRDAPGATSGTVAASAEVAPKRRARPGRGRPRTPGAAERTEPISRDGSSESPRRDGAGGASPRARAGASARRVKSSS